MDLWIPNILYSMIVPIIFYTYFCRYCQVKSKWYLCMVYVILYDVVYQLACSMQLSKVLCLPLDILLFAVFGYLTTKKYIKSLTVSLLILSVFHVCYGMVYSISYYVIDKISVKYVLILQYADMVAMSIITILLIQILHLILKYFFKALIETDNLPLLLLLTPVFFISLTEKVVSANIYGDVMVWDNENGMISPVVNHGEVFLLQAVAGICLFSILVAFQKMMKASQTEQQLELLQQQTKVQQIYMQEVKSRYEMTRAFRHDMKNHLNILGNLLQKNQSEDAYQYLKNLAYISDTLTYPIHTNHAVIDALLENKFSVATQKDINIKCKLHILNANGIKDLDWCIVLSNAIDNAIQANCSLENEKRFIHVSGKNKGNFYLLCIENACDRENKDIPKFGIGLSNIEAVVKKYHGTMDIDVMHGVFKLDILLVISQQDNPISHQIP